MSVDSQSVNLDTFFKTKQVPKQSIYSAKALSKQEGPNICWDAHFLNPFFES